MENLTQTLKELAIAYELACEFDYCPEDKASADDFLQIDIAPRILQNYSGLRPDEIANRIIKTIKRM